MYFFKQEKHFILGNIFKHKTANGCLDCYFRFHSGEYPCYVVNDKSPSTSVLVLWKQKKLKKN